MCVWAYSSCSALSQMMMVSPSLLLLGFDLPTHSSAETEPFRCPPERSKDVLILLNHLLYKLPEENETETNFLKICFKSGKGCTHLLKEK